MMYTSTPGGADVSVSKQLGELLAVYPLACCAGLLALVTTPCDCTVHHQFTATSIGWPAQSTVPVKFLSGHVAGTHRPTGQAEELDH